QFASPVIDVGCGTGEHTIWLAGLGLEVLGVDLAPRAIDLARHKAEERQSSATFAVADVLALGALGHRFRTAIDCGVFHIFDDDDRRRYVASLADVVQSGGLYVMFVFSDQEPADWGGPRRIRHAEIRDAFQSGWSVESIVAERFDTRHAFHAA